MSPPHTTFDRRLVEASAGSSTVSFHLHVYMSADVCLSACVCLTVKIPPCPLCGSSYKHLLSGEL